MRRLSFLLALILFPLAVAPTATAAQDRAVVVTIIYDNYQYDSRLQTDWGFSALIETSGQTILFDTGTRGEMFMRNFRTLGKDPAEIDVLVFSHDHQDHTGGLGALFETGVSPPTYLLATFRQELRSQVAAATALVDTHSGDEVLDGIFTTGQVGDAIPEQALVIPTAIGLVVITGCAHAGVVAMLERVRELSSEPIHLVMGGFHLSGAEVSQVASTVAAVRALGVEKVGASHCTGDEAIAAFASEYGDDFVTLGVGRVLTFPAAR